MSDKWCPEIDGAYRAELAYIEKHASASRDAAEITRLRAENERTKTLLARVTDEVARYNDEARKARADLAAAQERERVLREALEEIDAVAVDHGHYETAARTMHEIARAAMRGEP